MDTNKYIQGLFKDSIQTKQRALPLLERLIIQAAELMCCQLRKGAKIVVCGNGGSAADAQHFASELVNRFETDRVALPAIALTTDTSTLTSIANDLCYEQVFSRQIDALCVDGDVLMVLSTSGNSSNIVQAIEAAKRKNVKVIALTGGNGGAIGSLLEASDVELRVPSSVTARIQETHILLVHCLCGLIDANMASENFS